MNLKIVVDSTFALAESYVQKHGIIVVPLNVLIDGKSYQDDVNITLEEVLNALDKGSKVSTSQPSPELFKDIFLELKNQGVTDIVCMTISSTLSGTFNSASIASNEVEGVNIHLLDTLTTSVGAELLVHEFVRDINDNKSLDEALIRVNELKKNGSILMTMENLNALKKSGRLSRIKAAIGNLIKVKPLIEYVEGKVTVNTKFRTEHAVVSNIIDRIKHDYENVKKKMIIYISHVRAEVKIKKIAERIEEVFTNIKVHISREISPVVAINLGYGGFGVAWTYE